MRAKDPFVVFIVETWADEARLKDVKQKIQFENMFVVPREARGGGLFYFGEILWLSQLKVLTSITLM